MYDRDELAEVYAGLPRAPLFGLIDLVLDALRRDDPAELKSFRDAIALDGPPPTYLSPADLLDPLVALIADVRREMPIVWHLQRALAIEANHLQPRVSPAASDALRRHRPFIDRAAAGEPAAFLFTGLRVDRWSPAVIEHLRQWAERDVEVAACLSGSRYLDGGAIGVEIIGMAGMSALAPVRAAAADAPDEPGTWILPRTAELAIDLLQWLALMVRSRPGCLVHIRVPDLPLRVVLAASAGDEEAGGERRDRARQDVVFDIRCAGLPEDPDQAVDIVLAIIGTHPRTALELPYLLRHSAKPSDAKVRALAAVAPSFLDVIIEREWSGALAGAAELVASVDALPSLDARVDALLAIGRPSAKPLAEIVDGLLRELGDAPDVVAGSYVTMIADKAVGLGLPFWEKRLDRQGAFRWLWASARIREALALRPDPLYRLIRRAADRADRRDEGVAVLALVHKAKPGFPLAPVADSVVHLLRDHPRGIDWDVRYRLLASTGSADAVALLVQLATDDDIEFEYLILEASPYDHVWEAMEAAHNVQGNELVNQLREKPRPIGDAAARSVFDALLPRVHVPTPRVVTDPPSREIALLIRLLEEHRTGLGADRVTAALSRLDGCVTPEVFRSLQRPSHTWTTPELPWAHLFDSDLGHLLPQIGEWFAARVADREWMRVNVGKVLRPAVLARFRDALGEHGEALAARLGDRWPTRALIEAAAVELGVSVAPEALDRCADEAIPPVFRAALARLPATIEGTDQSPYADEHWLVKWVFEAVWVDAPELIARHVLTVFGGATDPGWRRGLALALVALREPCGTGVPDALTAASRAADEEEEAEFYRRQRDTFSRARAAQEQALRGEVRTREALHRIQRFARRARGVT